MKKLFLILICLTLAFACKEEAEVDKAASSPNPPVNANLSSSLTPQQIGEWHNNVVNYMYDNGNIDPNISLSQNITNSLDQMEQYLINNGLNSTEVHDARTASEATLNNYFSLQTDPDRVNFIKNRISEIATSQGLSSEFVTALHTIFDDEIYLDEQALTSYVNNLETQNWTDNENDYIAVFKQVLEHSRECWATKPPSKAEWVIINDTIGGVLGFALGGVGSILVGGFFSWGTERGI